jgi:hypothetical protein
MYTVHSIGYGDKDLADDTINYELENPIKPAPPNTIKFEGEIYTLLGYNFQIGKIKSQFFNINKETKENGDQYDYYDVYIQKSLDKHNKNHSTKYMLSDIDTINLYYNGVEGGPAFFIWAKDDAGHFILPPDLDKPDQAYCPVASYQLASSPDSIENAIPFTNYYDTVSCEDDAIRPPYWNVSAPNDPGAGQITFVAKDNPDYLEGYEFKYWNIRYAASGCVDKYKWERIYDHKVTIDQNSFYWLEAVYKREGEVQTNPVGSISLPIEVLLYFAWSLSDGGGLALGFHNGSLQLHPIGPRGPVETAQLKALDAPSLRHVQEHHAKVHALLKDDDFVNEMKALHEHVTNIVKKRTS